MLAAAAVLIASCLRPPFPDGNISALANQNEIA
jgi:hypothetical protein